MEPTDVETYPFLSMTTCNLPTSQVNLSSRQSLTFWNKKAGKHSYTSALSVVQQTAVIVILPGPPRDLLSGFLLYPEAQWS